MTTTLVTTAIWPELTRAVRRSKRACLVAVAYFGQGASKLLPLPSGSRLVVDASDGAVTSGQTSPAELARMAKRGVRIFNVQNLHAKVFVTGTKAFIGSANASQRSAHMLVEAVLCTSDHKAVSASRIFVRELCRQELGPQAIKRLSKMYRPPRVAGNSTKNRSVSRRQLPGHLPRVYVRQLLWEDPPEGSDKVAKAGRTAARQLLAQPKTHVVDEFHIGGTCVYKPEDIVVQVLDDGRDGYWVYPPGNVLNIKKFAGRGGTVTFVFLEVPKRKRKSLDKLAHTIGRGGKKLLRRVGKVPGKDAHRLLDAWNS